MGCILGWEVDLREDDLRYFSARARNVEDSPQILPKDIELHRGF